MDILKFLNEKMETELDIKPETENDMMDTEASAEDEKSSEDASKSRIRIETDSKIVGIIRNLTYDVKFKDLADRLKEEVPGVTVTRDKAKKIFNVMKDMMGF